MKSSIESFQRATRIDPDFAGAWYALANSYAQLTQLQRLSDEERAGLYGRATEAIGQATRIWPEGPHKSVFAAAKALDSGDWSATERELRKVEATTRGSALQTRWVQASLAQDIFLLATDRARLAVPLLEKERDIDPLSSGASLFLGEAYANSGNLTAAIAEQDRGMQLESQQSVTKPSALITALATGDRELINKRLALAAGDKSFGIDLNAEMKPYLDKPDEALRVLHALAASSPNPILVGGMALWAAYFGDTQFAIELLRDPSQRVSRSTQALAFWRPIMHDVRRQPGFKDLVRELGLVDYWREFGWGDHCKPVGKDDFECT